VNAQVRRREFITLLGGAAAAWPLAARAQQRAMPVIGYLNSRTADGDAPYRVAFHQGLKEAGFVEGQNVAIEYRWAEYQYDRLPELASELVRRKVGIIYATALQAAQPAKDATATIPTVFAVGSDPVKFGLVSSFNRPGGNITGVSWLGGPTLAAKRLELLHELVPTAIAIAVLVNPKGPATEAETKELKQAASALGLQLHVHNANRASFRQSGRKPSCLFSGLIRDRRGGIFRPAPSQGEGKL
jgi:putative tryptophan/tyrosine transport system substrate-binding protein